MPLYRSSLRDRDRLTTALVAVLLTHAVVAQSSVRGWRGLFFDTAAKEGATVAIDACSHSTLFLRADGRIFVQGGSVGWGVESPPVAPPNTHFVDVELGSFGLGLLSDGRLLGWGNVPYPWNPAVVPSLPPGVTYTQVSASWFHAVALRSDGWIVAWGSNLANECNVPPIPFGRTVVAVKAGAHVSAALLSDGTILPWGFTAASSTSTGFGNVPALPPGLVYTSLELSNGFGMAMRSDGALIGWGDTWFGLANVPPLPPGTSWGLYAVGDGGAAAVRSDNTIVTWGGASMVNPPTIPPGTAVIDLAVGYAHGVALLSNGETVAWGDDLSMQGDIPSLPKQNGRGHATHVDTACGAGHVLSVLSDGSMQAWGGNNTGQCDVPTLPPSISWRRAAAGVWHSAGITSNGRLIAWGDDANGQCRVPAPPPGVTYVDVAASSAHTVAVRSDGQAVAFGYSAFGALNIPLLPLGVQYVGADAYYGHTVLLRSDGAIANFGNSVSLTYFPPPGLRYVQVACGRYTVAAIRSDGAVDIWGSSLSTPVPALPFGVSYVQADCGYNHIALRRSDGEIVVCGSVQFSENVIPVLDPGTSYMQVGANETQTIGRVGPTCTYVTFATGCAGSLAPARLIPRDTPRIGKTHQVTVFDMPHGLGIQILGFQPVLPSLPLALVGMPGCGLSVTIDMTFPLVGSGNQAVWSLAIPDDPQLVGLPFHNQVLVLDANAPNTFGAVMSNAAQGVIGLP